MPTSNHTRTSHTFVIWTLIILIIAACLIGGWRLYSYVSDKSPAPPNNNPKGNHTTSKGPSGGQPATTPGSNVQPAAPSGQFVSNHRASLQQQAGLNIESSTCNTTPGVLCQIRFIQGSVTRFLPAQKTDADGNTIWPSWTLQSAGLTSGAWQVTAVASNDNKMATTRDAILLTVGP